MTPTPILAIPRARLTHALPVDLALGKVDYYEAVGFVDDLMATAAVWYRLLNCGFRLAAGARNRRHGQLCLAARAGGNEPGLREERSAARAPQVALGAEGGPELRDQRALAGDDGGRTGARRRGLAPRQAGAK